MTIYTHITEPQIVKLLSNNNLGDLLQFSPLLAGLMNSNYQLQTSTGDYILTIFEYVNTENLSTKLEFEQFLAKHDFPCSPALANTDGEIIQTIANKPCKLSAFIQGSPQNNATLKQCFAVGELLANLHLRSETFDFHLPHSRSDKWQFDMAERLMDILPTTDALLLQEEIGCQRLLDYNLVPKGVIHANCFTQNILFNNDEVAGLLDFYYLCHDFFITDLAIAINAFAKDQFHQIEPVKVTTILDGYQHHRRLNNIELELINPMRRTAALKIWLERLITQYLPGKGIALPPQDPDEYRIVLKQLSEIPKP